MAGLEEMGDLVHELCWMFNSCCSQALQVFFQAERCLSPGAALREV